MDRILNIATYAIGFMIFFNGILWLIDPVNSANQLGMPILTGAGLSTQIGDFSSFFLVVGGFTLVGAYTKQKHWFYAPIALLSLAAVSRITAYLIHNADLSTDKIFAELLISAFLSIIVWRS
ncbi:MAG: hypothetical protein CMQ58_04005 [Gammaproteobacteria bacterium]|nr:hypothetical protein [Gammaproteobacteria bacterium]MAC03943.1 hypothetical protein [Gammaproteobacteria bacterium]|tara:strand:+ start:12582 stop:12947 length:366 start_codon:yes stop_codon:yes gene_type:complete